MSVSRRAVLCDWVWRVVSGRPHRFPHDNFSSVYRIFTKLGHMIPLGKGKNPIYFRVIRSKVKVTVTINRIFDNRVVSSVYWIFTKLGHMIALWKGKNLFILGSLPLYRLIIYIDRRIFVMHTFLVPTYNISLYIKGNCSLRANFQVPSSAQVWLLCITWQFGHHYVWPQGCASLKCYKISPFSYVFFLSAVG